MFFPYFNITKVNVANLSQTNTAVGQNIAVGSLGVNQTLVQAQANSAAINQA
jgi:hypothetical protein